MEKRLTLAQVQSFSSWAAFSSRREHAPVIERILRTHGFKTGPMDHEPASNGGSWYYILDVGGRLEALRKAFIVARAFLPPTPVFYIGSESAIVTKLDVSALDRRS